MENRNLRLIDLTMEEMIYISSFAKTTKQYNIPKQVYHYGSYAEECVCINKNDENVWEVYIVERGKIHDKQIFKSCFDACLELLKYAVDTKDKYKELVECYKNKVVEMQNSFEKIRNENYIAKTANPVLQIKK